MKTIAAIALAVSIATPAFSGALVDPIVEPEIIIEEAGTSSSAGLLIPILLLVLIGVALAGGSSTPIRRPD